VVAVPELANDTEPVPAVVLQVPVPEALPNIREDVPEQTVIVPPPDTAIAEGAEFIVTVVATPPQVAV